MTEPVPILMYHRIGERRPDSIVRDQYVPEDLFARQLGILRQKGFGTVSIAQLVAALYGSTPLPTRKPVVITFDDGYRSFSEKALPILKSHGMSATVFLVSDCVGATNRWDEAKGDVTEPLMSASEIMGAHAAGTELGAHTRTHPDLLFCSDAMASDEIAGSKSGLEEKLRVPIDCFSYPFGKHGERERTLVRSAGFVAACGTERRANTPETDRFALGRINVRGNTSPAYLLYKLQKVLR